MAKKEVSTKDMYERIAGAGLASGGANTQSSVLSQAKVERSGQKRLSLDISIEQWRKLKHHAISNDVSMSEVVRGFIDAL